MTAARMSVDVSQRPKAFCRSGYESGDGILGDLSGSETNVRPQCDNILSLPRHRISRFHQLRALPERCPRMTCSTNSSPNRLVNGSERNNMR